MSLAHCALGSLPYPQEDVITTKLQVCFAFHSGASATHPVHVHGVCVRSTQLQGSCHLVHALCLVLARQFPDLSPAAAFGEASTLPPKARS